ncbi:hypothetical protein [Thioclava sp. GXIMD4215]|uniref:hypothetical protein n=1 Tax=Thioclava sp. GXIMD4215 TaxID=3131928 RepID=UPI00311B06D3
MTSFKALLDANRHCFALPDPHFRTETEALLRQLLDAPDPAGAAMRYTSLELDVARNFRPYSQKAAALLAAFLQAVPDFAFLFPLGRPAEALVGPHPASAKEVKKLTSVFEDRYLRMMAYALYEDTEGDLDKMLANMCDWPAPDDDFYIDAYKNPEWPPEVDRLCEEFRALFPEHGGEALDYFLGALFQSAEDPDGAPIEDSATSMAVQAWLRLELVGLAALCEAMRIEEDDILGYWPAALWEYSLLDVWVGPVLPKPDAHDAVVALWYERAAEIGIRPAREIFGMVKTTMPWLFAPEAPLEHGQMPLQAEHAEAYRIAFEAAVTAYRGADTQEEGLAKAQAVLSSQPRPAQTSYTRAEVHKVAAKPAPRAVQPAAGGMGMAFMLGFAVLCLAAAGVFLLAF